MAQLILMLVAGYAGLGVLFAAWFVTAGVGRLDASARGGPLGFRVLIFPGSAALWPWLLTHAVRGGAADVPGGDA